MLYRYLLTVCFGVFTILSSLNADELEAEKISLDPITVTADKYTEYLYQVPKSVSVIEGKKITDMAIRKLEDVSAFAPNLNIVKGAVFSRVYIRGIGSGLNQGFDQSVGIFNDGIYSGRGRQSRIPLLDVDRIEVLKGPQGLLFGKNTTAGAVNIISAQPGSQFESRISGLYAPDHGEKYLEGYVSGPIADGFSARIAGRISHLDGYLTNTVLDRKEPETEQQQVRAILHWDAAENIDVSAKYEFGHFSDNGRTSQVVETGPFEPVFRAGVPQFESDFNLSRSVASNSAAFGPDKSDTVYQNALLNVDIQLDKHTLTATSGYNSYSYDDLFDLDLSALSTAAQELDQSFTQFSQELRLRSDPAESSSWVPWDLDALEYMLGAYYQYQEFDYSSSDNFDTRPWTALGLRFPSGAASRINSTVQRSNSWAVFGRMTWHPLDDWRVVAGLRYTNETKHASKRLIIADLGTRVRNPSLEPFFAIFATVPHQFEESRTESRVAPMFSLQWDFTEQDMAYFTFSTGYKSGGFDAHATSGNLQEYIFADEYAVGYELGVKTYWLDDSLSLNIALFRTNFDNLQVSQFDGVGAFLVGNAAQATTQGVEVDSRWQVTEDLSLSMAVAFLDARYNKFDNATCHSAQLAEFRISGLAGPCTQDLSGKNTPYAPEWSGSFFIDHVFPLGRLNFGSSVLDELKLSTRLNVNFSDSFFLAEDLDPLLRQRAFAKLNVRIAIGDRQNHWEIAFLGRNLTNELTSVDGNDIPVLTGALRKSTDRPRTLAVQATVGF